MDERNDDQDQKPGDRRPASRFDRGPARPTPAGKDRARPDRPAQKTSGVSRRPAGTRTPQQWDDPDRPAPRPYRDYPQDREFAPDRGPDRGFDRGPGRPDRRFDRDDRRPPPRDRGPYRDERRLPPDDRMQGQRPRSEGGVLPPDVVTGAHAVEALLRHRPDRVREVYLWASDPRLEARIRHLCTEAKARLQEGPPPGLREEGPNPQGVAARLTQFRYADLDQIVPEDGAKPGTLLLVLDSITDPRNLGAILRSAAFFQVAGVILPQDRAAGVTPLVERIAEGGSAVVPVVQVVNLARTIKLLQERGVEVVGTALEHSTGDLRDHDWAPATALVLGAEGGGIRPLVRKSCDFVLTWNGPEAMPSLNVSAFAALSLALVRLGQRKPS